MQPIPSPNDAMMLQMKFDYDWPAGLRDIDVWKCECTHWRREGLTPARVQSYKLIPSLRLWWANKGVRVVTTLFIDFFRRSRADNSVVGDGILPKFKLVQAFRCSLLPAIMKKMHPKMTALEWSQHFPHYKNMGIFPDTQGQLTPQSQVWSCRNSNPSKILWLSSLPARIKKNQSEMKEPEWSQYFPRYNPMGAICYHGNQSSDLIWPKT